MPQLFVATGATMFADPEHFPWTIGCKPSYQTEARIYAKHILATKPDAKIGVLYQNDGFGKDYLIGLKDALGAEHAGMIVKEASYETSEPTVDSQIVTLQGSGADMFFIAATPEIRGAGDPQVLRSRLDAGALHEQRLAVDRHRPEAGGAREIERPDHRGLRQGRRPTRTGRTIPACKQWQRFIEKYLSPSDFVDSNAAYGFGAAATMVQVLKQCGDDLSRENIMRQAANLKDLELPMLLPGMTINTSPTNFSPIRQMQLASFDGASWEPFGDLLTG